MQRADMKDQQSIDAVHSVCLPGEERAYEEHCRVTFDLLAPVGGFERLIAQSIADGQWRLQRARSIEATLSDGRLGASDRSLRLLKQYQRNIQRACNSDLAHLKSAQAKRKKARQEAIQEAMNTPTSSIN